MLQARMVSEAFSTLFQIRSTRSSFPESRVLDKVSLSPIWTRDCVLFIGPSAPSRTFLFLPVKAHSSRIKDCNDSSRRRPNAKKILCHVLLDLTRIRELKLHQLVKLPPSGYLVPISHPKELATDLARGQLQDEPLSSSSKRASHDPAGPGLTTPNSTHFLLATVVH